MRPREIWLAVRGDVEVSANGYVVFDDTTLDKSHSREIELCGRHWSGNKKAVITGISVVTCVYVNPETGGWWVIDYRIYQPAYDGKTKLQHMEEMLRHTIEHKQLAFRGVLMDTWYATAAMMAMIHGLGKYFYCPVQSNRKLSRGSHWTTAKHLNWDTEMCANGQTILLKNMSKSVPLRLHRRTLLTKTSGATYDFIVTNDARLADSQAVESINRLRWKVEMCQP